ncbi:cell division protein FtsQ/DivIB [Amorphus sp. MBR-141]
MNARTGRKGRRTGGRLERKPTRALGLGTLGAFGLLAVAVGAGIGYGGHTNTVLDAAGSAIGFSVAQVHLDGQRETSESAILAALGIGPDSSLLSVDAGEARARLVSLPWIEEATVRKTYPGSVYVQIEERSAAALWQHESVLSVIDRDGNVLADGYDARFAGLPLLVGTDANEQVDAILTLLAGFPDFQARSRAAVYVGGRRWDVVLANGVQIRLPEHGAREALANLVEIDRREALFDRDIASIDVRLSDRIAIRPTEAALAVDAKAGSPRKVRREARI